MVNNTIAFKGKNRIIYLGDRFGNQTICSKSYLKDRKDGKKQSFVKIKCDCGETREICCGNLRGTCVGCTRCTNKLRGTGYDNITGGMWCQLMHGARSRNLEVSIDSKYLNDLFLKQNKKCALTGLDIFINFGYNAISTASVDRIDSSKGYIEGNVQFVHKHINKMKMEFDQTYFINMCKLISLKNG